MPSPALQRFRVSLRRQNADDSPVEFFDLEAYTRALAARAAEAANPGLEAVAVATRWKILGRCDRCNGVVFADDSARNGRDGPRCLDC